MFRRETRVAADDETRDWVGPVLHRCPIADAVVAAIEEENPRARIVDRGAYLRVLTPERCRVTRAAIERRTGEPFRLPPDLELIMPSFKGFLEISDDEATWSFSKRARP